MKELTSTSYAILGWLAVKPWTPYDLAKQMRRNLRFFWPRAESWLYEEPKSLVAHGLAVAETIPAGKRKRTLYTITDAGREALRNWLSEPSAVPTLWFDGLVRVFFADSGTPESALLALESARQLADEIQAAGTAVALEYLDGIAPFPQRTHLSGLVFDFLWGYAEHLRAWAERSGEEIGHWPEASEERMRQRALGVFRSALTAKGASTPRSPTPGTDP